MQHINAFISAFIDAFINAFIGALFMSLPLTPLEFPVEYAHQTQNFFYYLTYYDVPLSDGVLESPAGLICCQALSDVSDSVVRKIQFQTVADGLPISDWQLLNQEGFFVNTCLNQFRYGKDGKFKKAAQNVGRVRGYVVDIDTHIPQEALDAVIGAYNPTMVICSSNYWAEDGRWMTKAHLYFLFSSEIDATLVNILNNYKDIQTAIALSIGKWLSGYLGTPVACDAQLNSLSLALRIPGLYHQKQGRISLTTLYSVNPNAYLGADIVLTPEMTTDLKTYRKAQRSKNPYNLKPPTQVGSSVHAIPGSPAVGVESVYVETSEGGRNQNLFNYVYQRLFLEKGLSRNEALGSALVENDTHNKPPLSVEEVRVIVESAFNRYSDHLRDLADKLPITSNEARSLLLEEARHGMLTAEELSASGITVDTGEIDPSSPEGSTIKKKSNGTRKNTTNGSEMRPTQLHLNLAMPTEPEGSSASEEKISGSLLTTTIEIDPDLLP